MTARVAARPLSVLGVGAQFLANLSSQTIVTGWTVFVELGKVRELPFLDVAAVSKLYGFLDE